ncbi:MAG: cysteine--tRNA ligase, partial [Desulfobacteraceae bacterium]|nr:cysteine--tRNA ligase [Desulfobacteraceae bacterium]
LREQIVLLGVRLAFAPRSTADCLAPLVEELLNLRKYFRDKKQWVDADAIRECLEKVDITIDDTKEGSRWRLKS